MATTIPTGLSALEMLSPQARSHPGPADVRQTAVAQAYLRSDPPGQWAANKWEQTNHFIGPVSSCIEQYVKALNGAKITLFKRKAVVKKSASGVGHISRDDKYEPVGPEEHPLARVLEQPGGDDGVWALSEELAFLAMQERLTGEAPAYCPRNIGGKPVQFYALTSALTQVMYLSLIHI